MATNNTASGSFVLRKIRNGSTLNVALSVNGMLMQIVELNGDTASVSPDWTKESSNRPVITPVVTSSGSNAIALSDHQWSYNGSIISSADDRFSIADNGALTIMKNLASKDNLYTDTLKYTGKCTVNGMIQNVEASIDVEIRQASASEYEGRVYAGTDGTTLGFAANGIEKKQTTINAALYKGASKMDASAFNIKWYRNDAEWVEKANAKSIVVTRDDVNGMALIVARFFVGSSTSESNFVEAGSIVIVDNADEYDVRISEDHAGNVPEDVTSTICTAKITRNGEDFTPAATPTWDFKAFYRDDYTEIEAARSSTNKITIVDAYYTHVNKQGNTVDTEVEVLATASF